MSLTIGGRSNGRGTSPIPPRTSGIGGEAIASRPAPAAGPVIAKRLGGPRHFAAGLFEAGCDVGTLYDAGHVEQIVGCAAFGLGIADEQVWNELVLSGAIGRAI